MNKLLLMAGVLLATNTYSQEFQPDIKNLIARSKVYSSKADTSKPSLRPFTFDMLATKALQPEPGVYSLPQDGMPCIVPDTRGLAVMPNAMKPQSTPPANRMPNAMPEKRLLPPSRSWSK